MGGRRRRGLLALILVRQRSELGDRKGTRKGRRKGLIQPSRAGLWTSRRGGIDPWQRVIGGVQS